MGHVFGTNVGKGMGVLLRGKGPVKPQLPYDILHIHSLMIYKDVIGYNITGDKKDPFLFCLPFVSKLKAGDNSTTGQYIYYQSFSNLQFKPLLKNSSHSFQIGLRDKSGKKILFVIVVITRLVLMFIKASNFHF